jgi:hypothetical protein
MLIVPDESLKLQAVVGSSMSRHTFAIIQPSRHGVENQELATGVGVKWKGAYLIVTAGHVIDHCPEATLRYFLPAREIECLPTSPTDKTISVELRKLYELANPKPPVFADDADLGAILLPPQPGAEECFFSLDEHATVPAEGSEVGVFGYPVAVKLPMGKNFMASPAHFFGALNARGDACKHAPIQDFTVPYELPHRANGFSGSGVWYWSSDPVWTPLPRLVGIVATECVPDHVVSGYDITTVITFLRDKADFVLAQ